MDTYIVQQSYELTCQLKIHTKNTWLPLPRATITMRILTSASKANKKRLKKGLGHFSSSLKMPKFRVCRSVYSEHDALISPPTYSAPCIVMVTWKVVFHVT